jgi:hypothetical protein
MSIPLFDANLTRTAATGLYAEPDFRFLNRSSRKPFARVRTEFQSYYNRYPRGDNQTDVRRRFRSERNRTHRGAALELFVHELLVRLGADVTIHPFVEGFGRRPDFLANWDGIACHVEVTYESGASAHSETLELLTNQVYDAIDSQIRPTKNYLAVQVTGAVSRLPARSVFVTPIRKWLEAIEIVPGNAPPVLALPLAGGSLRVELLPTTSRDAKSSSFRPIGAIIGEARFVDDVSPVAEAIRTKGKGYPDTLPYVVVVGSRWTVDDDDLREALFGRVAYVIGKDSAGEFEARPQPTWDGVWGSPAFPRRRRISAVLHIPGFVAWSALSRPGLIVHNPWAERPLQDSPFDSLRRISAESGQLREISGKSLRELFSMPQGWPE